MELVSVRIPIYSTPNAVNLLARQDRPATAVQYACIAYLNPWTIMRNRAFGEVYPNANVVGLDVNVKSSVNSTKVQNISSLI